MSFWPAKGKTKGKAKGKAKGKGKGKAKGKTKGEAKVVIEPFFQVAAIVLVASLITQAFSLYLGLLWLVESLRPLSFICFVITWFKVIRIALRRSA